jgi:hypothetical protein
MKITNTSKSTLTFGYGKDAETVLPGETSSDLALKADDPHVVAHLTARNITVTGREASKASEAAGVRA